MAQNAYSLTLKHWRRSEFQIIKSALLLMRKAKRLPATAEASAANAEARIMSAISLVTHAEVLMRSADMLIANAEVLTKKAKTFSGHAEVLMANAEVLIKRASTPELPGCMAHGGSHAEALSNAEQAIALGSKPRRSSAAPFLSRRAAGWHSGNPSADCAVP